MLSLSKYSFNEKMSIDEKDNWGSLDPSIKTYTVNIRSQGLGCDSEEHVLSRHFGSIPRTQTNK
jgi:hypothetical protein